MEPTSVKICRGPLCNGIEKPATEFSPKASYCRKCVCHKTKEYYKLNDRPYRKFKNEIKQNSKCAQCGISDMRVLDFDHNKGVKNVDMCKSFSKNAIEGELQYTQILCAWCHRLKTRKDWDTQIELNDEKYNITDRPKTTEFGRPCYGGLCEQKLQYFNMFYNAKKKTYCKLCQLWRAKQNRIKNHEFLRNLKFASKECELCKKQVTEDTICCFDYDHIDPSIKVANLSLYVRLNYDTSKQMLEEFKKCRLLCCNCHRIHTAQQFNYKIAENFESSSKQETPQKIDT